jgi:hypothetical protein
MPIHAAPIMDFSPAGVQRSVSRREFCADPQSFDLMAGIEESALD